MPQTFANDAYVRSAYRGCTDALNEYSCIGSPAYMKFVEGEKIQKPPRFTNQIPPGTDDGDNKRRLFFDDVRINDNDDTIKWHNTVTKGTNKNRIDAYESGQGDESYQEWMNNRHAPLEADDFSVYHQLRMGAASTDWERGPRYEDHHTITTKYVPYLPTFNESNKDNYTYVPFKDGTMKVPKMSPVPGLEMSAAPRDSGIEEFTNKFVAHDTIGRENLIEGMSGTVATACDDSEPRTFEADPNGNLTQVIFSSDPNCNHRENENYKDVKSNTAHMTDAMQLLLMGDGLEEILEAGDIRKRREDSMNRIATKNRLSRLQMSSKLREATPQHYLATGEKHYIMDMMDQKEFADNEAEKVKAERESKVRHSEIATYYRKQFQMKKKIIAETAFVFFIIYVLYMLRSKGILPAELFNVFVVLILFVFIFFRLSWTIIDYSLRDNKYFDKYNWSTPVDSVYNIKPDLGLKGRVSSSYSKCAKNDYSTIYSEFIRLIYRYEQDSFRNELTEMNPISDEYEEIANRYEQFIERLLEDGKASIESVTTPGEWPTMIDHVTTALAAHISAGGGAKEATINDAKSKSKVLYAMLNDDVKSRLNRQIWMKITVMKTMSI